MVIKRTVSKSKIRNAFAGQRKEKLKIRSAENGLDIVAYLSFQLFLKRMAQKAADKAQETGCKKVTVAQIQAIRKELLQSCRG